MRAARLVQLIMVALLLSLLPATASASDMPRLDESMHRGANNLARLYAQILRDPTNTELNLQYGQLAEELGEPRKALAAYERILANDPDNHEAQQALMRVRRKIQPNTTQIIVEFGTAWESNPRRVSFGERGDWEALARMTLKDERALGSLRWRTIGTLIGNIYRRNGDLSYGYAGGYMGPVIDLNPNLRVHAALGGGVSYFDHRRLYSEAITNLTFESFMWSAIQTVRIRSGYRSYDDFFPSDHGFYTDVIGKFSFPKVLASDDVFIISPWFRWSGISGTGFSLINPFEEVQAGKYQEYGGKLEYYKRMLEWLTLGANVSFSQRNYASSQDILTLMTIHRKDLLFSPGATTIFHRFAGFNTDLRIDYRYEHNDSSEAFKDYINHVGTIAATVRF